MFTLTIDDDLLVQTGAYAQRNGIDLAALVAELLRPVAEEVPPVAPVAAELATLYGCLSLPADYARKAHLADVFNNQTLLS